MSIQAEDSTVLETKSLSRAWDRVGGESAWFEPGERQTAAVCSLMFRLLSHLHDGTEASEGYSNCWESDHCPMWAPWVNTAAFSPWLLPDLVTLAQKAPSLPCSSHIFPSCTSPFLNSKWEGESLEYLQNSLCLLQVPLKPKATQASFFQSKKCRCKSWSFKPSRGSYKHMQWHPPWHIISGPFPVLWEAISTCGAIFHQVWRWYSLLSIDGLYLVLVDMSDIHYDFHEAPSFPFEGRDLIESVIHLLKR